MSSESDTEEFYDAFDVTPHRQSMRSEEPVADVTLKEPQWAPLEHSIMLGNLTTGQDLLQSVEISLIQASQTSTLMQPPSQPFLHPLKAFQSSKDLISVEQPKIDISPSNLEKEERLSLSSLSIGKRDIEDTGSACSGSLLGNLGDDDDDEEAPRVRSGGRRRTRHQEVRRQIQKEDDDPPFPPSPVGSQSSSIDAVYPAGRTSHPFRVVEHDAASVYSSVSLGKVGKMLAGMEAQTIRENQLSQDAGSPSENKSIESSQSDPSKDISSSRNIMHPGETAGMTMCPEPDLVASTKSSSGSDKSNSLPRMAQEPLPNLPSIDITLQSELSEAAQDDHLPGTPPMVPTSAPSPFLTSTNLSTDINCQSNAGVHSASVGHGAAVAPRAVPFAHAPAVVEQPPAQLLQGPPPPSSPRLVPVAPPRRRRRNKLSTDDDTASLASVSSLPSPALTLSSVDAISIGQSLDIRQAVRGDYLVKPQDSENAKAVGPSAEEIARLEAEDTTSQASTPEVSRAPSRLANSSHQPSPAGGTPSTPGTPGSIPSDTPTSDAGASPASSSEGQMKQLNLMVRTRSDSGKELSDAEILKQVTVLNLDTGERIPLSDAENCLPQALNPLSLHIMRLTSEYVRRSVSCNGTLRNTKEYKEQWTFESRQSCLSNGSLESTRTINSNVDGQESDEESVVDVNIKKLPEIDSSAVKKKTSQLKKFLGRKMESAVNKARSLAHEVSHRHREEKDVFEDDAPAHDTMHYVKIKTAHSHKGPLEFDNLMYVQEIAGEHTGPIWCMKFSGCGRLLATAGQDHVLRVWVLKQAFNYFLDIRTKCNADIKVSPTPSQESLVSQHSGQSGEDPGSLDPNDDGSAPFMPKPFCVYTGHSADMLDISWSKNYFLLTSSMDKTVRLWHISRKECLCIFQHMDFVTAIAFHPKDDRYFISGALDGKLRLWSIPDKRVVLWNEVGGQPNLITAANFCQNGKFTVVGTYDGRCIFYETEQLKYYTQIYVRSTRGKNAKGRKITGIEPLPGEDKVLITSNDSRIRLYDLRDLNLSCKYKGYSNMSSQIRAGFSHDGKYIVAGSENQCIYIWKTHHDYSKFSSARRDRNLYWEGVKAHSAVVTCAVFAPHPELVFSFIEQQQEILNKSSGQQQEQQQQCQQQQSQNKDSGTTNKGYALVSADFNGCIKVFLKKEKPKHSSLPASAMV
ncbi:WD repeat-containing protein 44 isoform X3 [Cherax quadricarinatus]|uniref:WD repeat-containing protein 44 isoform X3 n=1 Tax=Cherax quadricarinatus TaxID=27406 RepID=UPI00387E6CC5